MTRHASSAFAAIVATAAIAAPSVTVHAQSDDPSGWKFSTGASYTSGDYGTADSTNILYVPFTTKYEADAWTFRVTVPYIRISGPGNVVGGDTPVVLTSAARTREIHSGLGDIIGGASYALNPTTREWPLVEVTGKVKFPTASESKGLGTGEFDYSTEVDLSKSFGALTPFMTLGYRFVGDPPGQDLDNVFYGSLGVGYKLTGALTTGVIFDYSQPTSRASDDAAEITPYLVWKLNRRWSTNVHALVGLTDGSPDYGGGIQLTYSP